MKIGAYQFQPTADISQNLAAIQKGIFLAAREQVELLVFPECALTGYPPRDIKCAAAVDFDALVAAYRQLQALADECHMHIVVGTVTANAGKIFNSAMLFAPGAQMEIYQKRALWGWDADNFDMGTLDGVFMVSGFRIGIRICFEVRFPEFFRELYRERTDLNVILFYDVADWEDPERYELIKSHIRTRAVENVCQTLSVNAIRPYQTAPTGLYDASGCVLEELVPNEEGLLIYDLVKTEPDFGKLGRRKISDYLIGR